MKKYLIFALVAVLLMGLLAGCTLPGDIAEDDILGNWITVKSDTQEEAMGLLEHIEAYEEEIALADLTGLEFVKSVEFHADGTYCFRYDLDGTKDCVREFYDAYFNALYEGRATLEAAYEEAFTDMTQAEFRQYFAGIYGYTDYIEMLDGFTEGAYNYAALEEPYETGNFRTYRDEILFTVSGKTEEESVGAALEEGKLTLTYIDGTETYTRK